ncbi:MAG: 4-hydroxy-tetrahydrodipicolinate reductase [Acidimicrobiia bacterium]
MIKVGVLGAAGRVGSVICQSVIDAADLDLVAAVDPAAVGRRIAVPGRDAGEGPVISASVESLADAGVEVAVDFTLAEAALANLRWCAANGVHLVCGTTGLGASELAEVGHLFEGSPANALVAPNFAIGAVLMMHFAELAARWFESAEIVELHHDAKVDAPSGTALLTASRLAVGGFSGVGDQTRKLVLEGARGGESDGGIRIHSVRLRGLVAHQEVLLGTTGQSLTIRHDSYDRTSFVPGVLLAVRQVATRPGLTVGLDSLLGLV